MTIYIIDIEAVDTRYTKQWKEFVPLQLKQEFPDVDVVTISGGEIPQETTKGAFLNFSGTNIYKSNQLSQLAQLFNKGLIKDSDYFLYTDAWNPTVIQLRYMASLLNININIGGMWHAGSYDPADFLGRLIGDQPWVRNAEQAMFDTYDQNFFATQFHIDLFRAAFPNAIHSGKMLRVGWPMEYMPGLLEPWQGMDKENIILFPHRIAPEKCPDIFNELAKALPQYEFIICQDRKLTKDEYHTLLGKAKIVFSANLQETLGISAYEGALVGALPIVPERLSYIEMYIDPFKYPSVWANEAGLASNLVDHVRHIMDNYSDFSNNLPDLLERLGMFFNGAALYKEISKKL